MKTPEQDRTEYISAYRDAEDRKASVRRLLNESGVVAGNQRLHNLVGVSVGYISRVIDSELVEPVVKRGQQYFMDNLDVLEAQATQEMESEFERRAQERARLLDNHWRDLQDDLQDLDNLRADPDGEEISFIWDDSADLIVDGTANIDAVEFYLIEGFMGVYAEDMTPDLSAELSDRINSRPQLSSFYQRWIELGCPNLYLDGLNDSDRKYELSFTLPGEEYADRRPLLDAETIA